MDDWEVEYRKGIPRNRREVAAPDWVFERQNTTATPQSELEAMMMAVPGEEPQPVVNHHGPDVWDNLDETIGVLLELSDEEKQVMEARHVAGLSIRESAEALGLPKSTVHRIEQSALERIRRRANVG